MQRYHKVIEEVLVSNGVKNLTGSSLVDYIRNFQGEVKIPGEWFWRWCATCVKSVLANTRRVSVQDILASVLEDGLVRADPLQAVTAIAAGSDSRKFAALSTKGWCSVSVVDGKIMISDGDHSVETRPDRLDLLLFFVLVPTSLLKGDDKKTNSKVTESDPGKQTTVKVRPPEKTKAPAKKAKPTAKTKVPAKKAPEPGVTTAEYGTRPETIKVKSLDQIPSAPMGDASVPGC